jgi:hypothetical protein
MLSPDKVNVKVMAPSNGAFLTFEIVGGEIVKALDTGVEIPLYNIFTVFSAPPSQWWNNVRFACSGIQICTSKQEAETWHARHAFHYGDVITLEQLWKLSKVRILYSKIAFKEQLLTMTIGMVFRES